MEDKDILGLYFARDEAAITETDKKYGPGLHRMADSMLSKEDGEECVNDTYLSAWNAIPPAAPVRFAAWLYKVLRNHIGHRISYLTAEKRKAAVSGLSEELLMCIPGGSVEEEIDLQELGRTLTEFLYSLKEDARYIFLRRYWFGDSVKDIAQMTGSTQSRIKVVLHRTRIRLKKHLEEEGHKV